MPREGGTSRESFFRTITAAVADFTEHGFDSMARLDYWLGRIRKAALDSLVPEFIVDQELRAALRTVYTREIERGGILKRHPGVSRFTLERVKPHLRAELDRRIMASAQLIKLNRARAIEDTLQRFSGWASSVPAGGSDVVDRVDTKTEIRRSLSQLPFRERRVAIDQGHKLVGSLNEIMATENGALAGIWHSHWRQPGYDYRHAHKERDGKLYAMRGNWALEKGLMKAGPAGYTGQITQPGEDVFCRCWYQYVYALRDLPDDMLTEKGRAALQQARAA